MDVAAWLRGLGLERYEQAFRDNEIDADVLPELTAEDLRDIGVTAVGHRRKLLAAIAALRAGGAAQPGTAPTGDDGRPESATDAGPEMPEGERRQVAVLFADLAGYTKLTSDLDAEEVHALLGWFFGLVDGVIADYGGTVDKHIGDCAMAVFGAPLAHGNDAERAVRAALEIQRRMPTLGNELGRPLGVHIGVASGQVVASGTGSASHREYTVTGESVNLASRLSDKAESGETLVSDAVHRALADRLECTEAGALAVKGLAEPVTAWRLLGPWKAPTAGAGRRPLVGRQGELQQFEAALAACRGSGGGRTVYVRGEAGIGKTRLVEEFQAVAERTGFVCHCGQVLDFGAGTGRDAIRTLVRGLLGLADAGDGGGREAAAGAAERTVAAGLVAAERRVYLNDLLDLPQPRELRALYDAMDNAGRNRGKRETVVGLVARASAERPRLLVVEDLHWADRLTLDYLATLTEAVAECPALLVLTSRIEGDPLDHAWRSDIAGTPLTTIDLGPLRAPDAEALAGTYLDSLGDVARRCVERAAGNPLFLEQLLRHAEESAEAGLPGSIRSLVQARIDRLDPADKRALQAASVLGQRFDLDALGALLQQADYDCAGLVRHFLVRPQGEQFLFAHALIREGVYDSLLRGRRRELHRRAAVWSAGRDPVLYAEHLDRAEDPGAPRAYLEAARTQAAEYRTERALRLVERGVGLAEARADLFALTCFQGELLHDLGGIPESIEAYRRALEVAEGEAERCRAWIGLAAGMRVSDQLQEAFKALEQAEAAAVEGGLMVERSRIHHLRGNLCFPLGNIEGCIEQHELALRHARQAGSPEAEARALGGLGDAAYVRGRMLTAHGNFRRCVELCREHGFGRIEVANANMAALTRQYAGELREARDDALRAAEAAAQVGHYRAELLARNITAFALYDLAQFELATDQLTRAHALIERIGARRFIPENFVYMAKILRIEGRRAEAGELLERAIAASREMSVSFFGPRVLAEIALDTDDAKVREEALAEGEDILRRGSVGHNHLWFYRDAIDASLAIGEWDGAERYAAALEAYTREEPLPWSTFFIARGRALAAFGRGGGHDGVILGELERLRAEAQRVGFRIALPALDEALAAAAAKPRPTSPGPGTA